MCSGSMMQKVFYLYAQHYIESLLPASGPVILLLDGHASCWTVQALRLLLMENDPFYIASHTLRSGCNQMSVALTSIFIGLWIKLQGQREEMAMPPLHTSMKYSVLDGFNSWKKREQNCNPGIQNNNKRLPKDWHVFLQSF